MKSNVFALHKTQKKIFALIFLNGLTACLNFMTSLRHAVTKLMLKEEDKSIVIPLIWYQDAVEKLLMCQDCKDVWIQDVPISMPLHQIECESCLIKGKVIQGGPRRR